MLILADAVLCDRDEQQFHFHLVPLLQTRATQGRYFVQTDDLLAVCITLPITSYHTITL